MSQELILRPVMSLDKVREWVTDSELRQAEEFGAAKRAAEYLTWRAVIRERLGLGVQIEYDSIGAPFLVGSDTHISISHTDGWVAVVLSSERCAVDIECEQRDFNRVASRFVSQSELALGFDEALFGVIWCAKEVLYKYSGRVGLDFLRDIHILNIDIVKGKVLGCVGDEKPITMHLEVRDGLIVVCVM